MIGSARYIDTVETAKLVRKALKAAFPEITFRVRSSRYSGGSSIHVTWTDGPTQDTVQAVAGAYDGTGFDGMTDASTWNLHWLRPDGRVLPYRTNIGHSNGETLHFRTPLTEDAELVRFCGSVSCHRYLSPEYKAVLADKIVAAAADGPFQPNRLYTVAIDGRLYHDYGSTLIWQLASGREW